jgi:bacterioferritin
MSTTTPFLSDVQELRRRARENMMKGPVTSDYRGDVQQAVDVLNQALATEIVCVLRYKRHYYMSRGIYKDAVADEFLQHANDEQGHADQIADRITQLGGEPNFNPDGMSTRSHSEYKEGENMVDMIKENLVAERVAIESYREMIRFFGDSDPTTRRMLESILAKEEEHANDMVDLLEQHEPAVRGEA